MADTTVTVQSILDNSFARAMDLRKTNDKLTDAQLVKYLNKGRSYVHQIMIRENSEIIIESGTITLAADTQEYTLSGTLDDFWAMTNNGVYFDGDSILTPVLYEDKIREGSTTTDTAPTQYYLTTDKIGLINIPTTTAVDSYGTLTCRYFKKDTPLTVGGNMPYGNLFNEALSAFMDQSAMLVVNKQPAGFTALYNALEEATLQVLKKRIPT